MTPTSEERKEVAARLRALDVFDLGDAGNVIDTPEESGALFARILYVVNDYRPGLHYATSHFVARDAVDLFADIIDPTCRMTDSCWDDGERTWGCICSACGAHIRYGRARSLDYCPKCGARVTDGGEG